MDIYNPLIWLEVMRLNGMSYRQAPVISGYWDSYEKAENELIRASTIILNGLEDDAKYVKTVAREPEGNLEIDVFYIDRVITIYGQIHHGTKIN